VGIKAQNKGGVFCGWVRDWVGCGSIGRVYIDVSKCPMMGCSARKANNSTRTRAHTRTHTHTHTHTHTETHLPTKPRTRHAHTYTESERREISHAITTHAATHNLLPGGWIISKTKQHKAKHKAREKRKISHAPANPARGSCPRRPRSSRGNWRDTRQSPGGHPARRGTSC
jgi:hypothetical protein